MKPWVWVVPEQSGGIHTYSEALWARLASRCPGGSRLFFHDKIAEIAALQPELIHIQHEYGCWGSKTPGKYRFPRWLRRLKAAVPEAKIIATAHSVIPETYRYPVKGKGWQAPLRLAANLTVTPFLAKWWNRASWGNLDAVVVHSELQVEPVKNSGCPRVRVIPHFVPDVESIKQNESSRDRRILVFGYFTPDKGQDIAIGILTRLPKNTNLVLAGGWRMEKDRKYMEFCQAMIRKEGLESRVTITGFLPEEKMDEIYADADLVLAPFRYTTGSGSLAHALARGKPVLASDLPLNREINERVPGCLEFFQNENPEDGARQAARLLTDAKRLETLAQGAKLYARKHSLEVTVSAHLNLYGEMGRVAK